MLKSYLYIDNTINKGRGVFTKKEIAANTVIEIAPVIVMSNVDRQHLDKTKLYDYIFEWGTNKDKCSMALGYIPIYNHSYTSNCEYFMDYNEEIIFVKTIIAIKKGSELCINYNGDWNDKKKVWFEEKE